MSLSTFIRVPEIRARFRKEFTKPRFRSHGIEMVAPPMTTHYSLVGTAFDYLFRFYLQRNNRKAITGPWAAESAVSIIDNHAEHVFDIDNDKLHIGYDTQRKKALKILKRAKALHADFMNDGKITNALLRATLQLAHLDNIFRSQ